MTRSHGDELRAGRTGSEGPPSRPRPQSRAARTAALCCCGLLGLALASATLLDPQLSKAAMERHPAPGLVLEVDGRRGHLHCRGSGSPVVVLEAGLPGTSLTWQPVAVAVSEFTRVCSYDRGGYGWSDPGRPPRTGGRIAGELRLLLQRAGVGPPYVLVGHSFGGLLVQIYAARYPNQTAGMVLVDAAHPEMVHATIGMDRMRPLGVLVDALARTGWARLGIPVPAGDPSSRPAPVREAERELLLAGKSVRAAADELAGILDTAREAGRRHPRLGSKPLAVLTQGRRELKPWLARQRELAELSENSYWEVVADAGHFVHHDRPERVSAAIRSVVEAVRNAAAGTASQPAPPSRRPQAGSANRQPRSTATGS